MTPPDRTHAADGATKRQDGFPKMNNPQPRDPIMQRASEERERAEIGQALAALTALEGLVGHRWSGDAKAYATCIRKALNSRPDEGEPDLHPEKTCQDCGGHNPVWFAPSAVWNLVMGGPEAKGDPGGIVCPVCFTKRAEAVGVRPTGWELRPERPDEGEPVAWADREAVARIITRAITSCAVGHLRPSAPIILEKATDDILALAHPPRPNEGETTEIKRRLGVLFAAIETLIDSLPDHIVEAPSGEVERLVEALEELAEDKLAALSPTPPGSSKEPVTAVPRTPPSDRDDTSRALGVGNPLPGEGVAAAPATFSAAPVSELVSGVIEADMTPQQIEQWIDACNHEPAKDVLRHYLRLVANEGWRPPEGVVVVPVNLSDEVVDAIRAAGPVVLVEREVGRPWARTLLPEEVRVIHRATLEALSAAPAVPGHEQGEPST